MRSRRIVMIGSCSLFLLCNAYSQAGNAESENVPNSSHWINIGIGKCYFGPTFYFGLSYAYNEKIFSVRYLKGDEFRFNVEGQYDEPLLRLREFAILYGISSRKEYGLLALSIGIGIVDGRDRGKQISYKKFEQADILTLSIPLEVKMRIEVTNNFGIGASFFGNLNVRKTYWGGMLDLYVGKF